MTRVLDREKFREVIAGILNNACGLSRNATRWETDPRGMISDTDRADVSLEVFSMSALAVDEHRVVYNLPGQPANSLTTSEIGNRTIVITLRAEAFDKSVEASELIDAIRTGIRAETVTAQLNAINLAYVWSEQATRVRVTVDERVVNTAIADFTFAGIAQQVTSVVIDGSGAEGGWIQTVDGNNIVPGTLTP
jgi:hypothetical protein